MGMDWNKFVSRKLMVTVASAVVSILVVMGKIAPENASAKVQTAAGIGLAIATVVIYVFVQGNIDKEKKE